MAYATAALVKTYLGITTSSDDTLITALIARAQSMLDNYTHRTFEVTADTTKYFNAYLDRRQFKLWFTEGLELAANPTTITNGDLTTLTVNTHCVMVPANKTPYYGIEILWSAQMQWVQSNAGDPQRAISVVGKWGYSTTPPDDIVAATIRLVSFLYRQRESSADMDRPVSVADGMVLLPGRLPADIAAILEPYRVYTR